VKKIIERKKVGKYKEKEKYRENLKKFYDKKIKEWQTI
tara:strand:- start:527 stop:640 length:114 start_codon:yes stop_codon:yes gene_type:complete